MPRIGERKTIGGVTGEWDGATWRRVAAADDPTSAPKIGERKTKDGVTGEWDGKTWRRVAAERPRTAQDFVESLPGKFGKFLGETVTGLSDAVEMISPVNLAKHAYRAVTDPINE